MDNIRRAVSLVFVHHKDIFTIVRQNYLRAFPGYTAFPGGKVDKEDMVSDDEETLLNTVKREAQEELGININELLESKVIKSISKIAKATSPDFNPARFEVIFYRIVLSKKIPFQVDMNEAAKYDWLDASSLMQEYNFGKRLIITPIRNLIDALGVKPTFEDFLDFDLISRGEIPMIETIKNLKQFMPLSNTLPPASRTNCFVIGDQVKVLVDPSPKDITEYRKLLNAIREFQIDKVFITHHHSDHHQFAPEMARALGVPIFISTDSYHRCLNIKGDDYFTGIEIKYVSDHDVVGTWRGNKIIVHSVSGHDEGQLALAPESLEWCIVGDLFQGIGTVVVGGPEGCMTKYINSLHKIINLDPQCVIPSHGIALGGTHILKKTLEHRKFREEQVLELLTKGLAIEDILQTIYFDLSKKLLPYARANIESHIIKLKAEKKYD
jgi:glyoxylase-like metal-dependent hydrolase (beta-lactamase superfamily II)/8-oxo-dGTP pyrophosphatase MutT (NUDIX family)